MTRGGPGLTLLLVVLLVLGTSAVGAQDATTEPSPSATPDRVTELIEDMTLRQKVGQLFASRVYGYRAKDPAPGAIKANREYLGVDDADELLDRFHVGSIVYFGWAGNLQNPRQVAKLSNGIQRAAASAGAPPVLISTDQEHGVIRRLGSPATRFPGNMALGATRSTGLARDAARVTGEELRAVGIAQDLAPVADVNVNAANPVIGIRSFGSRPGLVASLTGAQVRGFQEDAAVAATVKHFPGHGDTDIDSHTDLPTIRHDRSTWWTVDAPPFEAAIEAGAEVIMTAHVAVPALDKSKRPATLSHAILTDILRERMGYEGVIMTDSLNMAAVRARYGDERVPVLAIRAGADILADPPHLPTAYRAVLEAVEAGDISEARIDGSVERILRLKERLGLLDEAMVDPTAVGLALGTEANQAVAQAVGDGSVTVLRDRQSWLPLRPRWSVLLTGWKFDGTRQLQKGLQAAGRTVETRWTGGQPTPRQIAAAVRGARKHDATVVVTGYLGAYPQQRALLKRLLASDARVIIVSARSPYDSMWFPTAPAHIATYSSAPVSMRALAGILDGEIAPTGTSPVRIPYPGRRGSALFPFGRGKTW